MASCCKRSFKSLGQAQDLTITLLRSIRSAISGNGVGISDEKLRERLAICAACEEKQGLRCKKCGCYLSVKAVLKEAECPLRKWPLP